MSGIGNRYEILGGFLASFVFFNVSEFSIIIYYFYNQRKILNLVCFKLYFNYIILSKLKQNDDLKELSISEEFIRLSLLD